MDYRNSSFMKTLIISFDKEFPIKTAGDLVVYSYDLINDLVYEVSNEISGYLDSGFIGDKKILLSEFEKDRPSQYNDFISLLKSTLIKALSENNLPESLSLPFPEGYVDWLRYNTNPQFVEIGKRILKNNPILQIKPREIYEDYIQGTVIPAIDKLIGKFSDIHTYTITDINDNNFQLTKEIKDLYPSIHFLPFYNGKIQREIGLAYYNGTGTVQNWKNAFHYFERGAEDGDPDALCYVGIFYENGQIIEQDFTKALNYYRESQRAGSLIGSAYLGHAYQKGIGTKNLYNLAIKCYKPSADAGILMAQENLGDIYYEGLNGFVRYDKAYEIYSKIKNKPSARTSYRFGKILYEGLAGSKNELEALKHLKLAAFENIEDSCFLCGQILENKETEIKDEKEPYQYYKQGAEAGEYKASTEYAIYLKNKNETSEIEPLLKLGVEKGYAKAQYELALYLTETLNENFSDAIEKSRDEVLSLAIAQQYQPAIDLNEKIKQQKEIQKQKQLEEELKRQRELEEKERNRIELEESRKRQKELEEEQKIKEQEELERNKKLEVERIVTEFKLMAQTYLAIEILKGYFRRNTYMEINFLKVIELLLAPSRFGYPLAIVWLCLIVDKLSTSNIPYPFSQNLISLLESSVNLPDKSNILIDFFGNQENEIPAKSEKIIRENHNKIENYFKEIWDTSISIELILNHSKFKTSSYLYNECYLTLIYCYLTGTIVEKSFDKALEYFEKSNIGKDLRFEITTYQGKQRASINGYYYYIINIVEKDFVRDLQLLNKIATLKDLGMIENQRVEEHYFHLKKEKEINYQGWQYAEPSHESKLAWINKYHFSFDEKGLVLSLKESTSFKEPFLGIIETSKLKDWEELFKRTISRKEEEEVEEKRREVILKEKEKKKMRRRKMLVIPYILYKIKNHKKK